MSIPVHKTTTAVLDESDRPIRIALGILGAAAGGCVGHFVFLWIARQGFYALVLPPAALGLGAGWAVRCRSTPFAIGCGVTGLGLALFTEWRFAPFVADDGLSYFIRHLHELRPMTLLMVAIGSYVSYRLALGSDRKSRSL